MTSNIGRNLGGFHHGVDRHLAGMKTRNSTMGWWEYLPLEVAMASEGIYEVETCIICHYNTTTHYIATCMVLEVFLVV